MDFGKVDIKDLGTIDFRLPEDDPRTWLALTGSTHPSQPRIGIGAPVWSVKDWVGSVYPAGTPNKDFLTEYAKQFNSIELNSTHYGTPDSETIKRWRDSTPDGFKFNVKFLQEISHRFPLGADMKLVTEFCDAALSLEDRLGITFLQLSPHFSVDDVPQLQNFLKQIPKDLPISVEVRHPSFFREHVLAGKYYDVLRDHGAHAVITDVAGRRDVLHTSLPTSKVLIRFIGNSWAMTGIHATDEPRLLDWSKRLKSWLKLGLEQVEFFVHEPDNKLSPDLIAKFIEQMNDGTDLNLPTWKPFEKTGPAQLKFF